MNILGTEYEVEFHDNQDDYMKENNLQGYCDFINKEIHILHNECEDTTLKHETIHGFLFESGLALGTLFHTEECVDWMAMQLDKIYLTIHSYTHPK